jgi:fumarylacetoacetase
LLYAKKKAMIEANNPNLKTWLEVTQRSDFPIQNIPFGIAFIENSKFAVSRIGDTIINLSKLYELGAFHGILSENYFDKDFLNDFLKKKKSDWRSVRNKISEIFTDENYKDKFTSCLYNLQDVEMCMPVKVGDYTDFYSSRQHAYNVGCMFRDPDNALLPNWLHIPVGYHGRASSIILSGTDIYRPKGQQLPLDLKAPVFGPCKLLDFELEMAFITGEGKPLGDSISIDEAEDYIFGMVIFNDWSARDIQKWEYVPLGPFLAKNFASSISPWIVTLDALDPFRCKGEEQEPEVLPYLKYTGNKNIDINLEVQIESANFSAHTVSKSNYKYMYWNLNQQLAHHTVNGCDIHAGDMMASGTISGNDESAYGSMLELSWKGTKPLLMPDGSERKFINDGDTVIMKAHSTKDNVRIGFGEVRTKVLPTK